MPSYEYHCAKCDRAFVVFMSVKDHESAEVHCPTCKETDVEQVFSSFFAVTSKKS